MAPESPKRGGPVKPRTCTCCGETKATHQYSWNAKRHEYCPTCRDCGIWLTLLRQVFGKTRDWESNRVQQRDRDRILRLKNRPTNIAGVNLWNAWHQPKDSHA